MKFYEIKREYEINHIIKTIKDSHLSVPALVLAGEYETTMSGKCILNIYAKMKPVVKIEGEKELLDLFSSRFRER
jgi:hypothetical protein